MTFLWYGVLAPNLKRQIYTLSPFYWLLTLSHSHCSMLIKVLKEFKVVKEFKYLLLFCLIFNIYDDIRTSEWNTIRTIVSDLTWRLISFFSTPLLLHIHIYIDHACMHIAWRPWWLISHGPFLVSIFQHLFNMIYIVIKRYWVSLTL